MNATPAPDRVRLSAMCLFLCALGYFASAWKLYEFGGERQFIGVVVGIYALALYVVIGVLAIDLKRWAWRVSNAAFVLHIAVSVVLVVQALQRGALGLLILLLWVAVGAIGLWANLRPASKAALIPASQGAA